jgi:hypothetical protein
MNSNPDAANKAWQTINNKATQKEIIENPPRDEDYQKAEEIVTGKSQSPIVKKTI